MFRVYVSECAVSTGLWGLTHTSSLSVMMQRRFTVITATTFVTVMCKTMDELFKHGGLFNLTEAAQPADVPKIYHLLQRL